tara:strand:- start:3699 stop:4583 length:885 start_codon:yes stop_codon:yes gene_type:complete
MKISVFPNYGSLNSQPVFKAFIEHLQSKNEDVQINKYDNSTDVAVIWSVLWRGRMEQNRKIWEDFKKQGKPVVVLEVGGIKRNSSWKVGINGINNDADFANQTVDNKRWPLYKIEMKPWKQTGNVIVICGQHNSSLQWKGLPTMRKWLVDQAKEIRKVTDKPILIRPHPRELLSLNTEGIKGIRVDLPKRDWKTYDDTNFKNILKSTWAVVNHSSNPAMEAVFNGIPVFVSNSSLCQPVGNVGYADLLKPNMPNRQNWANKLAYTEWFVDEIREGKPWARIRERLLEKYINAKN